MSLTEQLNDSNNRFIGSTSIRAGFLSKLFSSQPKVFTKVSKGKKKKYIYIAGKKSSFSANQRYLQKKEKYWLEKSLDRKPALIKKARYADPIEVDMLNKLMMYCSNQNVGFVVLLSSRNLITNTKNA